MEAAGLRRDAAAVQHASEQAAAAAARLAATRELLEAQATAAAAAAAASQVHARLYNGVWALRVLSSRFAPIFCLAFISLFSLAVGAFQLT